MGKPSILCITGLLKGLMALDDYLGEGEGEGQSSISRDKYVTMLKKHVEISEMFGLETYEVGSDLVIRLLCICKKRDSIIISLFE